MDERRYYSQTTAERPWSGGRPWHGFSWEGDPVEDLCGTGADLAVALNDLVGEFDGPDLTEVGERARGRLVDMAVSAERVKAWATSVQSRAVAQLHAQFMAEEDLASSDLAEHIDQPAAARPTRTSEREAFELAGRATSVCVTLALGVSASRADRILALALGLAEQPVLAAALGLGRMDEAQARVVLDGTAALPLEQRTRLVESIAADPDTLARATMVNELRCGTEMVWAIPAHKLRPILNREIAAIAPESIKPAEQMAKDDRRVEHRAGTIGCPGSLLLQGPEHELAAVFGQLDQTARAARKAGAPETLDQLRFDLAIGSMTDGAFGLTVSRPDRERSGSTGAETPAADVTGSGAGRRLVLPRPRRTTQVDVVVAASTLLGLDDRPAVLRTPSGDVPMSPELVRELAHDDNATWRRILCDPATGSATDVSGGYQPGHRVAEFCAVRDGHTSRFPTSGARHSRARPCAGL
jgi:hypothetical protein